jgi:hypothetical protein
MTAHLEEITTHDDSEQCVACRAQDFVLQVVLPAVGAWERAASLPRLSIALHGAAGLLGSMLAEGIPREEVESSLALLLDEIEGQLTEDQAIGAPQGTA